jgi:His-Xaa-Ser system protein HxsD
MSHTTGNGITGRGDVGNSDANGDAFTLAWERATVPLEGVERALYALADQLTGTIKRTADVWSVTIHPRVPVADRVALEHRLRQEVNDQTLRVRIAERTDPLRNLVFALAFSRSGLVDGNSDV